MKTFFSTLAAILVAATIVYTIKAINDRNDRIEAAKQGAGIQHQSDIEAKEAKDDDERIRKRVQEDPAHASLADRIHVKLEEKLHKGHVATPQPTFDRKGDLEGEVFIVSRGGENYKLGLVPIALYSLDSFKPYLEQKKQQAQTELARLGPLVDAAKSEMDAKESAIDAALQAFHKAVRNSDPNQSSLQAAHFQATEQWEAARDGYYDLKREHSKFLSVAFYFDDLPEPLVTTQTNSDGKFTIEMPAKGNFAIAAHADRTIGDSTEHYYWLVKVSLDGAAKKALMLANNNLSSKGSSDSLITTSD